MLKKKRRPESKSVLICFGGSDIKNLTLKALKIALEYAEFAKIIVVTGIAYMQEESIKPLILQNKKIEYHHAVSGLKMQRIMFNADVAIVPASGILFEALASGCKVISGYYVSNQKNIYKGFLTSKSIIDAGNFNTIKLRDQLQKIKSFNPKRIIDGDSPQRIVKLFKSLTDAHTVISR